MGFLISVAAVALTVLALIDVVRQPDNVVRNLPKIVWILLIVFIPFVGIGLWFILGHEWKRRDGGPLLRRPRPRSRQAPIAPVQPLRRSTEEQLADLEREEEHYRRIAEQQRREREDGERPQDAG